MNEKLTPTEARQGEKLHVVRYVLFISLAAVIIGFAVLLLAR